MNIERFECGPYDTNGYLLYNDNKEALIIDPSFQCFAIIDRVKELELELLSIILTHAHFDHFLGIFEIFDEFGDVEIRYNKNCKLLLENPIANGSAIVDTERKSYTGDFINLEEGRYSVGSFEFTVFETPGHTPGGISLLFGNDLFTGDTLFRRSIGRSDWQYSNGRELVDNIKNKLFTLPNETVVWPGHGGSTTIGEEKQENPFIIG